MASLSQASRLADLPSAHDAFQGHAAHSIEWSICLGPRTQRVPVYPQVFPHSSRLLHGAAHAPTPMPLPTPGRTSGISLGSRFPPLLFPWHASQGSRVHTRGLKQHAGGGVLLNAPSPLWGSPVFLQGQIRLTWSPIRSHPREEAWVPAWHKPRLAGSTGCHHKQGLSGATFPEGLCTLQVMHHGMP